MKIVQNGIFLGIKDQSESLDRGLQVKKTVKNSQFMHKMVKSESSDKGIIGSKGALAIALSHLRVFPQPKVRVEQYPTDAEIAAEILWFAHMKGDVGKVSADLGAGTGILGIGTLLLGESETFFVDSDKQALAIAQENLKKVESEYSVAGKAHFVCQDINMFQEPVYLVMQNPPFGVKVRQADRAFLKKAFEIADVVYSFHKTESKTFVERFSTENLFSVTNVWDVRWPLRASYSFHSKKIKYIDVSCFRLEKQLSGKK